MRLACYRQAFRHYTATWVLRCKELLHLGVHGKAWRAGYGQDAYGAKQVLAEAVIRYAELAGVGLLVSCADALLHGGRYRRLSTSDSAFAKTSSTVPVLSTMLLDEGAVHVAGRMRIAFVLGHVVKSYGALSRPLLIHELVHVRQFERWGWAYVAKALAAQHWGSGYAYSAIQLHSGELNAEQEAAAAEDVARRATTFAA